MSRSDLILDYGVEVIYDIFGNGPAQLFNQATEPSRMITPPQNIIVNPNPNIDSIVAADFQLVYAIHPSIVPEN